MGVPFFSASTPEQKKKIRKFSIIFGILVLLILSITFYFKYYYTYSDGYRTGMLQKFSRKGVIFKTYEGELWQNTLSTNNNTAIATEKLMFSVTDEKIAHKLELIQGKTITIHYHQKNNPIFWRGASEYIVDEVKDK